MGANHINLFPYDGNALNTDKEGIAFIIFHIEQFAIIKRAGFSPELWHQTRIAHCDCTVDIQRCGVIVSIDQLCQRDGGRPLRDIIAQHFVVDAVDQGIHVAWRIISAMKFEGNSGNAVFHRHLILVTFYC